MKLHLIRIICCVFLAAGCDSQSALLDVDAPQIRIISPEPGSGTEYSSDPDGKNSIRIQAEITDNDELHEIFVSITQDYLNGSVPRGEVMRRHYHAHEDQYTVLDFWMIDTAYQSNVWIHIEATDHNLNYSKDSVHVYVEN